MPTQIGEPALLSHKDEIYFLVEYFLKLVVIFALLLGLLDPRQALVKKGMSAKPIHPSLQKHPQLGLRVDGAV